jgi:uncharacterized OsmC-like protein
MDAATLRARQGPLKQQYRDDPESATSSVGATGTLDGPGFSVRLGSWAGPVVAGLHPGTGGDGSDACSGDMLVEALVACAGVTLRSVAHAMGVEIRSAQLRADATFDARGTLAVSREIPVGLSDIRFEADLDTDADDRTLTRLAELTERYCVVSQTLRGPVTFELRRISAD